MLAGFVAALALICAQAVAGPMDRILMLDLGFGWPQLAGPEASIYLTPHLHAGLTFGILPGGTSIFPQQNLQQQSALLPDGNIYYVTPNVKSTFFAVSPFIRFFLSNDRPVYLQFMCSAFTSVADITGPITDTSGTEVPGASVTGKVILAQLLPTLSLGHIWHSKLYFFNLSLGISYVASIVNSTQTTVTLPVVLDTSEAEQAISQSVAQGANNAANSIRNHVTFLPSIWASFGLLL